MKKNHQSEEEIVHVNRCRIRSEAGGAFSTACCRSGIFGGDILVLGVGGKMGPSLARLAANAVREGGGGKRIIGVSRFSNQEARRELEEAGVQTISCDLLNDGELRQLPEAPNVIYMAGNKFGTTGREYFTWAMNSYLPGRVAEKFKQSRMVVFSSGNVYPFSPVGAAESTNR